MDAFIQKNIPKIILTAAVLVCAYFVLNIFSYFSPLPWCKISISVDLPGDNNREKIKDAVRYLRSTDHDAYRNLCKNVNHIYEKYCISGDWHLDKNFMQTGEPGCYIRGSKSIYLSPSGDFSSAATSKRADILKKLAKYSQDYWTSR